ncbi:JDVT-CTERM system glutamic-type intramembrane protease [Seleniivibrio woodruffii]|uniref:JDVT-CTERM system glutamic-type intramembrane protease MrtJ n=1 Tax=Seleniivibrio woodruffii TaxID=1078050 RepID=UPI0026EFB8F0|nr:JDVT-CTERM system glutamic-type intramembrane protease [Seleniivibrio woodruffii]
MTYIKDGGADAGIVPVPPLTRTDVALLLFFIFLGFFWIGLRLITGGRFVMPSPYMLLVFFIFAPVAEELFFRGLVQNWLKRRVTSIVFGVSGANVLASALFAGVHIAGWGVEHGLMVFAPSLVIGFLYDRTGRVSFAILLHSIYNLNAAVV